jgi:2-C-methyl-D-erythritol 4-phosphate cytidylyltransferase
MDVTRKRVVIELSADDFDHLRDWQRLSNDEKEAITKIAKALGSEDRRKSFYSLLEAQSTINNLVVTANHIAWITKLFFKAGAVAGVIIGVFTAVKLLMVK